MTKRWCPFGIDFDCTCDSGADDVSHGDREIGRLNTWAVTHELMMVQSRPIRAPDRRIRLRGEAAIQRTSEGLGCRRPLT